MKNNPLPKIKLLKSSVDILKLYENNIGFYSSCISFCVAFVIPFTIYFENDKFDKGIQYMMSKLFLNLTDIILMQPKFHAQFIEIYFSLSYLLILSIKSFSFINLFFGSAACSFTFFIFYMTEQLTLDYNKLLKAKKNLMKLNNQIFKMIKEPILILYRSFSGVVFKNQAFSDLQNSLDCKYEIDLINRMKNEKGASLKDLIAQEPIINEKFGSEMEASSVFTFHLDNKMKKKRSYLIRVTSKKLKQFKEGIVAFYLHDIGNELELKVLEKNVEFTNLMLYSLSHEVRTPLNGIQGILQLLKNKIENEFKEKIKIALACSSFLVNQINCMLDYSEIIKNEFQIHLEQVNLNEFFSKMIKIAQSILVNHKSSIKIKYEISENINSLIFLDCERVRQVILNLITNSVKYTKEGYIIIGARLTEIGELEIYFSDTGCGFFEEQVSIFNEDDTEDLIKYDKEKKHFPGYKLSICRLIVKMLKSKLILISEKGKGSKFSFCISKSRLWKYIERDIYKRTESGSCILEDSDAISLFNHISKYLKPLGNKSLTDLKMKNNFISLKNNNSIKSIIVVDDVELNRFVISGMIKNLNFNNISEAENGKEAVEIAQKKHESNEEFLIFMDIDMPIMNGLESSKLIRKFSDKPIIAVTAFIGEEMRHQAKECGMSNFITKPISIQRIKTILREYNFI